MASLPGQKVTYRMWADRNVNIFNALNTLNMKRITLVFMLVAMILSNYCESLNAQNMKKELPESISAFPIGDKLPEMFSRYFIG